MVLETQGISKRFGAMYALRDVSIHIRAGEFHALVGENGAGKSTLIKILSGIYPSDGGDILWQGKPVAISHPRHSRDLGITVIHQDRYLIPSFTGIENVYLGLPYETEFLRINWKKMRKRVMALMDELNIHIPPDTQARYLSPPQRTQVEIIRAMMTDCRLLILDEPTAALTDQEAAQLFAIIRGLQNRGTAILYVSHRLDEVMALSGRITVLKNGRLMKTLEKTDTAKEEIISLMTDNWSGGAPLPGESAGREPGDCLLEVLGIASGDGTVRDMSFNVHAGEILGLFGLGGSGRTESLECVYGLREMAGGRIRLGGESYPRPTPRRSIQRGMVLLCEDRRGKALITRCSVKENTVVSVLDAYSRFGCMDDAAQERDTREQIKTLAIKTSGPGQPVEELSGGNQQKVVFAKAMMASPRIILCDEPTQAVDVKTRYEIHGLLRRMASQGKAVVFVSSDLKEILEVADRVQIIVRGRSRECFENKHLSAETVLRRCYAD
ncbi:MAG: sugar ABC transporter ATP-binding protein [Treponema sp.]|jgi:ribose transport system ATP-binding protein|nr:sugar ABC transporter ATP-binding protein [Treponema sp.]